MTATLGVFAKWPTPGRVKTRLGFADARAADVAYAFLRDTLARLAAVGERRFLVYSPPESRDDFATLHGDYELTPQADGDLGDRLEHFLRERFAGGATKVVVLGSDSPTLPVAYVAEAFARLDAADVVLGPATDGGYYLLGCRRVPPVFAQIDWSGPDVLWQTVARLGDALTLTLLPPWYDVDTPDGWAMLRGHVAAIRRAGDDPGVPATEALWEGEP